MTMVDNRPAAGGSETARRAMVDSQLRVSGVNADIVRERMGTVLRENFVPEAARGTAYMDRAIALGNGRFLAAPLVHGRMLEEAAPTADDKVLLVDGGSGYMAELLRPVVASLEVLTPGEAVAASTAEGDFTLLMIDGAIEHLPESLARRLGADARVVTGLMVRGLSRLAIGRKTGGEVALMPLTEMGIPVLPEFAAPKGWSF